MLKRLIDLSLKAVFLTATGLYKIRNRLEPTVEDENRLMLAWIEAGRKRSLFQAELDHATFSRLSEDQVQLVCAAKAAHDKYYDLLVKLRALHKAQREKVKNH